MIGCRPGVGLDRPYDNIGPSLLRDLIESESATCRPHSPAGVTAARATFQLPSGSPRRMRMALRAWSPSCRRRASASRSFCPTATRSCPGSVPLASLRCIRSSLRRSTAPFVLEGTHRCFSLYPGLTPWAKINSAAAGLDFALLLHRADSERVHTSSLAQDSFQIFPQPLGHSAK